MEGLLILVLSTICFIQARPQSGFGDRLYSNNRNLNTNCARREVAPGRFKFTCEGVPRELLTFKREHILWLRTSSRGPEVIDIEVPNYKIDELIKAGFTKSIVPGSTINLLLRKPSLSTAAEVQEPETVQEQPIVNLQYENTGNKQITHFPNDKPYQRLSGPILPPLERNSFSGRRNSFNDAFIQRSQRETTTDPLLDEEKAQVFNYY